MNADIRVSHERFEDAGEKDADGFYDYYYSGLIYRLTISETTYVVFLYDDEPGVATFKGVERGPRKTLHVDRSDETFRVAVAYFTLHCDVKRLASYEPELGYFRTYEVSDLTA